MLLSILSNHPVSVKWWNYVNKLSISRVINETPMQILLAKPIIVTTLSEIFLYLKSKSLLEYAIKVSSVSHFQFFFRVQTNGATSVRQVCLSPDNLTTVSSSRLLPLNSGLLCLFFLLVRLKVQQIFSGGV